MSCAVERRRIYIAYRIDAALVEAVNVSNHVWAPVTVADNAYSNHISACQLSVGSTSSMPVSRDNAFGSEMTIIENKAMQNSPSIVLLSSAGRSGAQCCH